MGNAIPTIQDGNVDALIGTIVAEVNRLQQKYPDITAVGFGPPGIINPAEGLVVNLTNVKGWRDIPLRVGQTSIDYQGKDFVYGNKGALEA